MKFNENISKIYLNLLKNVKYIETKEQLESLIRKLFGDDLVISQLGIDIIKSLSEGIIESRQKPMKLWYAFSTSTSSGNIMLYGYTLNTPVRAFHMWINRKRLDERNIMTLRSNKGRCIKISSIKGIIKYIEGANKIYTINPKLKIKFIKDEKCNFRSIPCAGISDLKRIRCGFIPHRLLTSVVIESVPTSSLLLGICGRFEHTADGIMLGDVYKLRGTVSAGSDCVLALFTLNRVRTETDSIDGYVGMQITRDQCVPIRDYLFMPDPIREFGADKLAETLNDVPSEVIRKIYADYFGVNRPIGNRTLREVLIEKIKNTNEVFRVPDPEIAKKYPHEILVWTGRGDC